MEFALTAQEDIISIKTTFVFRLTQAEEPSISKTQFALIAIVDTLLRMGSVKEIMPL